MRCLLSLLNPAPLRPRPLSDIIAMAVAEDDGSGSILLAKIVNGQVADTFTLIKTNDPEVSILDVTFACLESRG